MVAQVSTLHSASADGNLTLDNFDDILHALTNADSLPPLVIDESPGSTSDGVPSHTSRGSSEDEPTAKSIASRRRLYRENQKLGRDGLRRQVVELSEELARLKRMQAVEKARLEASCPPAFYVWKSCALRQRDERQLAEAEQRRLMAAVHTQATYIDTLSNIAHKRRRVDYAGNSPKEDEAAYFDSCVREAEANCARAAEVFEACSFDDLETNSTVGSEQRRDSNGELAYFQQLTKEVQPYSLYDTGCSVWDVAGHYHAAKDNFKRYEDVDDPENTYAATFTDTFTLITGEKVEVRQRLVSRRSFEDDRIVLTWKFISEGQGSLTGLHADETGWSWLYPSKEATEPGTVIATCKRRAPRYYSSVDEAIQRQFDQMLQEYGQEAMTKLMTSVDKLMLDNALAGVDF